MVEEDGEEAYEVEAILDSKNTRWGIRYLVKWTGYGPEHNSWQSADECSGAEEEIAEFHSKHPDKPGNPSKIATTPQKKRRTYNRSLFPAYFFRDSRKEPLTTGVDTTLPDELTCARTARLSL